MYDAADTGEQRVHGRMRKQREHAAAAARSPAAVLPHTMLFAVLRDDMARHGIESLRRCLLPS